eukprot:1195811-Prorocentrum_minimum.AAC.5
MKPNGSLMLSDAANYSSSGSAPRTRDVDGGLHLLQTSDRILGTKTNNVQVTSHQALALLTERFNATCKKKKGAGETIF